MVEWEHLDIVLTRIYKSNIHLFNHIVKFMIDMPHTSHQKDLFTSKLAHLPTVNPNCPCCKLAKDTPTHLYYCTNSTIHSIVQTSFLSLLERLQQL